MTWARVWYASLLLSFHWSELSHVTTPACRSLGIVVKLEAQEKEEDMGHFCQTTKRKNVSTVSGAVVHCENVDAVRSSHSVTV